TLVSMLNATENTTRHEDLAGEIWSKVTDTTNGHAEIRPRHRFPYTRVAAAVAALVLASVSIWYVTYNGSQQMLISSEEQESLSFIEEFNTTGTLLKIHLSDGTVVDLENNSRLKYRKDYTGEKVREVYLKGEGVFDVAKNPKQPFLVYSDEVVTKVLGTTFRIKAYEEDKQITVSVLEGKVSVYSEAHQRDPSGQSEVNGVVLAPNQRVVYSHSEKTFNKTLVELPQVIDTNIHANSFLFENAPAKEVFDRLEEAYGIAFIYDSEVMQDCFITVPLGDESLFEKLDIICRTVGATYELIDASIVITSNGCKPK
ncbi:MAG TPA: FecR family protein, partial [Chryseolinea sp.]|nr:FecR family protein [Chryseolinea sp.]